MAGLAKVGGGGWWWRWWAAAVGGGGEGGWRWRTVGSRWEEVQEKEVSHKQDQRNKQDQKEQT